MSDDDVAPRRRERVLEVGHEDVRARVERVDHHLALDRTGDLDEPPGEIPRDGRDLPVTVAHFLRLGQEVELLAAIQLALPLRAPGEELLPARIELAVQALDEGQRLAREDRFRTFDLGTLDLDAHARLRKKGALCSTARDEEP